MVAIPNNSYITADGGGGGGTTTPSVTISNSSACNELSDPDLRAALGCDETKTLLSSVQNILNFIIAALGIVAVIFIIIGAVQYVTSQGDPGKTKRAKDTITYAIIGLVVAILAGAIVNFVLAGIFSQ